MCYDINMINLVQSLLVPWRFCKVFCFEICDDFAQSIIVVLSGIGEGNNILWEEIINVGAQGIFTRASNATSFLMQKMHKG